MDIVDRTPTIDLLKLLAMSILVSGLIAAVSPAAAQQPLNSSEAPVAERAVEPSQESAKEESSKLAGNPSDTQGRPIGRISFQCDLALCQDPLAIETFVDISGLHVGQPITENILGFAKKHLVATGFFQNVVIALQLVDSAVFVEIRAKGATLVRKVLFEGVEGPPFESELRKTLSFRQGQAYRKDPERIAAQLESLRTLYQREGYFGTNISMLVESVGGQKHLVDLVFRIKKGERRTICDVGVRGNRLFSYSEVRDLILSDLSFVRRRLGLLPAIYTKRGFKLGQEALVEAYRRKGYYQFRIDNKDVRLDAKSKCVTLILDLNEGPHWSIVFEGNERFSDSELIDQLPFFSSGYVDAEEIRRAEAAISRLYETRGHPFVQIKGEELRRDRLDRTLVFKVREGRSVQIAAIALLGNTSVASSEILSLLGTRPLTLFDPGGYLQTDQVLSDMRLIEDLYRSRGFLQASVPSYEAEVSGGDLSVVIDVVEGPQTLVERVELEGNRAVSNGSLLTGLGMSGGQPFDPSQVRADLSKLTQRYSAQGYPLARIRTTCRLLDGTEVPCAAPRRPIDCERSNTVGSMCTWPRERTYLCRRIRDDAGCAFKGGVRAERVVVKHSIREGPWVEVGHVLLKGNFDTDSRVIYRELPLKRGELLDTQKVIEGQGNLRSMNLFDSVGIETIGLDPGLQDREKTTASLLISVEESTSRFFDLNFGLELRELLTDDPQVLLSGEVEYNDRNLFGMAQGLQPQLFGAVDAVELARSPDVLLDPDLEEPLSLDYFAGAEIVYNHPRFLKRATGVDRLLLTLTPFYVLDLVGVLTQDVRREEWGLRTELRKEIKEWVDKFFVTLGLEFKQSSTFDQNGPVVRGERIFSPRTTIGKLAPEIALDRRDSPLNPTRGYLLRLEPAFVSGDALGGGGQGFLRDSFLLLSATASYYFPFWGDFVLGQSLRYGQAFALVDRISRIPSVERFRIGGVRSLRGFDDLSLATGDGRVQSDGGEFMVNGNVEVRYPLVRSLGLFGATFFDLGLLDDCYSLETRSSPQDVGCYEDVFDDEPWSDSLRMSAGIGVRALILDQIPVVVDYAVLLNRKAGEKFGQIHANIGYTFD
jgi:outer membrane protein insertion porin family